MTAENGSSPLSGTGHRARSWIVFGVAVLAYIAAVTQRSTLGVASVDAADRFSASAALLSTMAVLQLTVYALLQVPVGVLIDRFGSARLIAVGTAIMVAGQLTLAVTPWLGFAIAARIGVGVGDAVIFNAVIRLLPSWFSGRTVPILTQWVGTLGALGQLISAIPFAIVLHEAGWTTAFVSVSAISVLALVLAVALLRDRPSGSETPDRASSFREAFVHLGPALRRPGTQLGFWSHFVTQSPGTLFSLFWGYPFMVSALGFDPAVASAMLSVLVIAGLVVGPLMGVLTARFPMRRSNLVLGSVALMAVTWSLVLAWPGVPPAWLIAILVLSLGVAGPGSMIGFDFARTFNPRAALGSANGIVNVGGFSASVVMMLLVGVTLDVLKDIGFSRELYSLESFRLAFVVLYLVIGFGVIMLVRSRRRVRSQLQEAEGITIAPLWLAIAASWRRSRR